MTVTQAQLDALWDFGDAAGSEGRLREAAQAATDAATRAELETQIARALGLQGRFDEADALLDAIPAEVATAEAAVRVRIALERGRLRNSGGDPDGALALFREATEAAASDLVFLRVDGLHMLAIADPDRAEAWTAEALEALEDVDDARTLRWRVSLHNNAGWARFDAGRVAEAIVEFERAKDAATCWGTPQQVAWADEALAEARAALGG
ncbi:hypothetical protein AB1K54_08510 [Microbacterium sp. BWT-B31]|uniref:hypothetical protein n=1 Tax=Microbacterium sp. BWT-B31 TaxID=3232072 RepID=UPI0035292B64